MPINAEAAGLTILLVDDNEADVRLAREVLHEVGASDLLVSMSEGGAAWDYLASSLADQSTPDIVLLDLNMPGVDGKTLLSRVKNDEMLKVIPVVIFSTSRLQEDIKDSYSRHANAYVTKPKNFEDYIEVMKSMRDFWGRVTALPSGGV